jgi:Tfp pilus assembly protein PilP
MPLLKAFSVEGAKEVADDVLAFVDVEMLVVVKEVGSIFGIYSGRVAEVEEEL